jgi:type I restriction enzyme, S subunit
MIKETEIPEGYLKTEVGIIPCDWKVKKLTEIGTFKNGINKSGEEFGFGYPFVNLMNVFGKTNITNNTQLELVNSNDIERKLYNLKKGDVLFIRSSVKPQGVGLTTLIKDDLKNTVFSGFIIRYRENGSLINAFKEYCFYTHNFRNNLIGRSTVSANTNVNQDALKNLLIAFPESKSEQTAIASALSDTDALIENLENLITKKRNIKQGAMQELFTGEKRLAGFGKKWEEKKLGELGKTYGGLSGKSKIDFEDGNYPYIPFLNILNNPVIDSTYFDFVTLRPEENQHKAQKDDLFFNGSSETPEEVGMCSVLLDDIPNLYLNSFCFGFRLFKELETNGLYLSYFFRSNEGRKLIYSLAQGATRYNLSKNNFLKMILRIPGPKEQSAIANFLYDMDAEIEAIEQKLYKYRMIKQGMMQILLTGKIRLK